MFTDPTTASIEWCQLWPGFFIWGLDVRKGLEVGACMLEWVKAEGRSVDVEQDGVASTGRKRPGFCTWKCALSLSSSLSTS